MWNWSWGINEERELEAETKLLCNVHDAKLWNGNGSKNKGLEGINEVNSEGFLKIDSNSSSNRSKHFRVYEIQITCTWWGEKRGKTETYRTEVRKTKEYNNKKTTEEPLRHAGTKHSKVKNKRSYRPKRRWRTEMDHFFYLLRCCLYSTWS